MRGSFGNSNWKIGRFERLIGADVDERTGLEGELDLAKVALRDEIAHERESSGHVVVVGHRSRARDGRGSHITFQGLK